MTPGLAGPPFPPKATKGSTVAIASLSKPNIPMVVGVCEVDVASLSTVQGAKGHAVRGVHFTGDELWSWSADGSSGRPPPDNIPGWGEDSKDKEEVADAMNDLEIEDKDTDEGGVALEEQQDSSQPPHDFVQGEDPPLPTKPETAETNLAAKGRYQTHF